jgi:multiple sugar transport system permease protein
MADRAPWQRRWYVATMVGPSALGLMAFTLAPLCLIAVWSFTHFDLLSSPRFIGLDNYRFAMQTDPFVRQAIENTLWLLAVGVPIQLLTALGLALILARPGRATAVARTAVLLPSVVPPVAATLAFSWLLQPNRGPVNRLLGALHLPRPLWFYDPGWAKPGLVLLGMWGIGPVMIMYVAGLVRIPTRLYEAAALEGAGRWQRFRRITVPMLAPVLLFTLVLGIVGALQYFTQAFVAAANAAGANAFPLDGPPQGSTRFYSTWFFRQAFELGHYGYASMLAFVLFVAALVAMAALLRLSRGFTGVDPGRR